QVAAGAAIATIALQKEIPFRDPLYKKLNKVSQIRQILLVPPLILDPPMNKRTGKFEKIGSNPLEYIDVSREDWLCYPAKVGSLVILVYFHNKFLELGHSLCNLFELADDADLQRSPDGVFLFGVPGDVLDQYGVFPTVFYEDLKNDPFVAAVPGRDEFGYFGYVKKMVLTLHNIIMMKQGRFPFHGALVRLILQGGKDVTLLFMGDTGAGKSETLEALREVGEAAIQDMIIIADDMGSICIDNGGDPIGYGTETGAFLRLDDLKPGYALGQIDRAIIMNPNMVNARIILPVTTYDCVIRGEKVDYVFYANNYEEIDEDHPLIERMPAVDKALAIFKEGTVMSKGTTSSSGIVHSYFANIFGPPQYRQLHEAIAEKTFQAFFDKGIFVGQIRTRLGLSGWEKKGPVLAAQALLDLLVAGDQDKE
ncbi:MAG TPA: phosphoenolpyruvate carboxykinase, partial [Candidatus Omnitrophota bacterium]|nr:phosphoenolpyruvate carboxykinase [Candidatus Omnitrophota bacterium]